MRTLFWKIFLSFWAVVAAFIVIAVFLLNRPTQEPAVSWQNMLTDVFAMYAQNLMQAYERGGAAGLDRYLQRLAQTSHAQAFLLDGEGNDASGRTPPVWAVALARRAENDGKAEFSTEEEHDFIVQPVVSTTGVHFVAIAKFPHVPGVPPKPPSPMRDLAIALTISGAVCLLLAQYLSAPIVRLRNAAQELSKGNLAARAGASMERRGDEIAELVKDFDQMAGRIEALISSQKRLVSDVSHEFRSPLTRINLAVELIRKVHNPAVRTAIARIEQETERLNAMVGYLLTLSSIDARGPLAEKTPVNVAQLLAEIVKDTDFEASNCNCHVVLHARDNCTIVGNADLLRSAIENVIRNAIRYTAEQTEIEVRLTCDGNGDASLATIRVRDHGPGVPDSSLKDLFRPFFRLDESRERSTGGAGLGLAIAQQAVKLHDGEISAQNCAGGGLEVTISFPVASSASPTSAS